MLENLDWQDGNVSIPGIYEEAYCIPKSHITAWPTLPAVAATAADACTYTGAFTLLELNTWKKINHIDGKSSVTAEVQGEPRSQTFLNKATFKTSLTTEEATAWAKYVNNSNMVFVVREKNSGKWRLLGNEMFNTLTKPSLTLGGEPTSERGLTIEIEVTDSVPIPFYPGAIMTDDGDVAVV